MVGKKNFTNHVTDLMDLVIIRKYQVEVDLYLQGRIK